MRRVCLCLVLIAAVICEMAQPASAKTHKDNYSVSCDVLWPAVKDAVRNSGKYGIVGIDNAEMSISYVIGGTLGGKRINSVVLNRLSATNCEMQTQTAYSGLIHNDAGDFKQRVDASLAKLQQAAPKTDTAAAPVVSSAPKSEEKNSIQPAQDAASLKKGQTQEEVEKLVGKPKDTITLKESVVYIYPTYKVIFEKGVLTEIQYPDNVGK